MRAGIQGKVRRGFVRTTDSNHSMPVFGNLLNRDFTATGPNQRWVGDITYLRTPNGFVYLATVLDLFSRTIVGWAVSAVIDRHLRRGNCYDNAAMESWFGTLKTELGEDFESMF